MNYGSADTSGLDAIDTAGYSPREAAIQTNLLQLLSTYPEAAKYLGSAALAHLQMIKDNTSNSNTASAAQAVISGLSK